MTHPTPPKRYTIITDYSNGKKTILESHNGFWVKYTNAKDYALNYANELAKQARLDALEEAAKLLEDFVVDVNTTGGKLIPVLPNYAGRDVVRGSYADAIRKLKEGV